jgi:hypothetical protein
MPAFRLWALMPIGNPKSMQAWDGVKYLGQLYAYAETSLEKGGVCTENSIRVDDVTESPKLAE